MPEAVTLDGVKLLHEIKVELRLYRAREMRLRLWIGLRLIALAALITGMQIIVVDVPGEERP